MAALEVYIRKHPAPCLHSLFTLDQYASAYLTSLYDSQLTSHRNIMNVKFFRKAVFEVEQNANTIKLHNHSFDN